MADVLKKVPVREQDAKVRATNFDEVCLGYNKEEAMEEAARCLNCKNAKCIDGCPVSIDIPAFIHEVKEGNIEEKMMYNTYNMGLGMVLAIAPEEVDKTIEAIKAAGEKAYVVGHIENGEKGVTLL